MAKKSIIKMNRFKHRRTWDVSTDDVTELQIAWKLSGGRLNLGLINLSQYILVFSITVNMAYDQSC